MHYTTRSGSLSASDRIMLTLFSKWTLRASRRSERKPRSVLLCSQRMTFIPWEAASKTSWWDISPASKGKSKYFNIRHWALPAGQPCTWVERREDRDGNAAGSGKCTKCLQILRAAAPRNRVAISHKDSGQPGSQTIAVQKKCTQEVKDTVTGIGQAAWPPGRELQNGRKRFSAEVSLSLKTEAQRQGNKKAPQRDKQHQQRPCERRRRQTSPGQAKVKGIAASLTARTSYSRTLVLPKVSFGAVCGR